MAFHLIQSGGKNPGLVGGIGNKPQDTAAPRCGGFKRKERLDRLHAVTHHAARRGPMVCQQEIAGLNGGLGCQQTADRRIYAVMRGDRPCKGHQVAPMHLGPQDPPQRRLIARIQGSLECRKPLNDVLRICPRRKTDFVHDAFSPRVIALVKFRAGSPDTIPERKRSYLPRTAKMKPQYRLT